MNETLEGQRTRIEHLAALGVHVATGSGTPVQIAVTLTAALSVPLVLARIAVDNPVVWWVLPLAVLAVDFLSGLVHWLFDTRIRPGTGLLGRAATNFLDHHVHPRRSAEVGFAATTWRVALCLCLPFLTVALLLPAGWTQAWMFWLGALSLVVAQTHKEAHRYRPAAVVQWLQRWHISLPPMAHRRHHRDHLQAYCVFTGWWNPLLDRTGFWRRLERLLDARHRDPATGR